MSKRTGPPNPDFSTEISSLGPCEVPNPAPYRQYVHDHQRNIYNPDDTFVRERIASNETLVTFEVAGPRERIFFEPTGVSAAVVTCGGLCPGLNDVIRAIVHQLFFVYGVESVRGVRFGFSGLNPVAGWPMVDLNPDVVQTIHEDGGTFLGSSRGPQPVDMMVDTLGKEGINILFAIGGDGTLRGAHAICEEITRRGLPISVVGVPKTIDNDIDLVSRTFGFDTAVSVAVESIRCAHTEAKGAVNGIGIVKLMGRHSGYIAANAALAQADVNFVLIPEVRFELEGPKGLLEVLEKRLRRRNHAVLVVAEGAGQDLFGDELGTDPSGNRKLGDIGVLLKERIAAHFRKKEVGVSIKYIDPSYIIRSVPANPNDCIFCAFLAQNAVHAGLAGKTGMLIGSWNNRFTHVPIQSSIRRRKQVYPDGMLWRTVLESTGQPARMINE